MSIKAAQIIAKQITEKPDSVLGLATGSTPIGIYQCLVEWHHERKLDFSRVHTVNLDEYCDLPNGHPQSYSTYMKEYFFRHVNLKPENCHLPNTQAEDLDLECRRYEALIDSLGGIDLLLLGLGQNGHIGFNEPSDHFRENTWHVVLDDHTRAVNARFFDSLEQVPRYAITMGIGTIMRADRILLAANGKGKAEMLQKALTGPVTPEVPASILQNHEDLIVMADRAALSFVTEMYAHDFQ